MIIINIKSKIINLIILIIFTVSFTQELNFSLFLYCYVFNIVNLYSFFLIMNAMLIFLLIVGVVIFFVFLAIESYKASDLGNPDDKGTERQNEYARYMFYMSIVFAVLTSLVALGFAYSKFDEFSDTLKGIKTATVGGDGGESGGSGGGGSSKKSGGPVKWNEWKVKNGASSLKVTADRIEGSKDAWIKLPGGSELKVNSGVPFKQGGPAEWDVTVPGDTNEGFITLTVGEPGPYQYKEMLQVNGDGKLIHTNPIRPARAPSGLSSGLGYAGRPGRNINTLPGTNNSNFLDSNQLGVPSKGYQNQQQQQQQQQKKNLGNQNQQYGNQNQQQYGNQNQQQRDLGGGMGGNGYNKQGNQFGGNQGGNNAFQGGKNQGGNNPFDGGGGGGGGNSGLSMRDFQQNNSGVRTIPDPSKTNILRGRGLLSNFNKKDKVEVHYDGFLHAKGYRGEDLIGPPYPG
jgi:hypothetical protein